MPTCDEATINADWQFNVNTWQGGAGPIGAPYSGLVSYVFSRQLDLSTMKMAVTCPDADRDSIETLAIGQRHNPNAQQT